MIKLYKNDLVIAYIKELLKDFNLPLVPVLTDDTIPYKGRMYIKDRKIGYYGENQFEPLYDYIRDYRIVNLTKNFIINSSSYDEYTHNYLGEYLRFLRDYDGINLMGLYNCFYKQQPRRLKRNEIIKYNRYDSEGHIIEEVNYNFNIDSKDSTYNYYLVPVKFNKFYTISIPSAAAYELALVIYNNQFLSETGDRLIKATYKRPENTSSNYPFLFSTFALDNNGDIGEELWPKEKYLRLLIKIPAAVKSSITILEGNWITSASKISTMFSSNYIIADEEYNKTIMGKILPTKYPNQYISDLSLIRTDDKLQIPFSDRLVEYLLHNAIDSNEFIDSNIRRLQDQIYYYLPDMYGIWNDNLRVELYDRVFENDLMIGNNVKFGTNIFSVESGDKISENRRLIDTRSDLLGFVDKDLERQIELIIEREI